MNPQPNTETGKETSTEIKAATAWVMTLSIGLIVLGTLSILLPRIAAAFFTSVIGWIALIGGLLQVVQAFQSRAVKALWLSLVVGVFYGAAGLYILFNLDRAIAGLTLAFGLLFIAEGIFTIIMAFTYRAGGTMSWFVAINGIITLILGILVINRWPFSSPWLIGLYVGTSLLFSGASLLGAALAARKEVA
ncbi:HdeD family acid-resistance protein [Nodosilinea sp. PGN35]|uniref:HdeD family acid-resistance protein n=1 Tax=Nodosilinea sp. PGN35 TaxID=3020489 RepID=UPI0023B320F2|nr:DUF308 domain-containing protein [Nodosilinea sp. TSF1-S3]MDF0368795.1 DUF308 domain-containing protein [Nodosilinea sp. TSF1-S3]